MNFIGATRKQIDKPNNDDAFAVFDKTFAVLIDGAGNVRGAAKKALTGQIPPFTNLQEIVTRPTPQRWVSISRARCLLYG